MFVERLDELHSMLDALQAEDLAKVPADRVLENVVQLHELGVRLEAQIAALEARRRRG
jgi:hypothetical protein